MRSVFLLVLVAELAVCRVAEMSLALVCGGWDSGKRARGGADQIGLDDRRSRSPHSRRFVGRQPPSSSRPPISWKKWAGEVIWFNLLVVTITPIIALYGLFTTQFDARTARFSVAYYVFNMLGAPSPE